MLQRTRIIKSNHQENNVSMNYYQIYIILYFEHITVNHMEYIIILVNLKGASSIGKKKGASASFSYKVYPSCQYLYPFFFSNNA